MSLEKGQLIVSCQALEHEPLHSSFIMGRMALAAHEGGAKGIRANSVADILEIKENVDLPIIGILKKDYADSEIFITPTYEDCALIADTGVAVVAMDATTRTRPNNETLQDIVEKMRANYPNTELMADCATFEDAIIADQLGFDYIGTTLVGYTNESKDLKIEANDFELIQDILNNVTAKVIAEGNIDTPEKVKRTLQLGCYAVVVGSIITRPQLITKKFVEAINE